MPKLINEIEFDKCDAPIEFVRAAKFLVSEIEKCAPSQIELALMESLMSGLKALQLSLE